MTLTDRIRFCLSTSFGLGAIPFAPGTWGTLPGVAIYAAAALWAPAPARVWLIAAGLAAACAVSVLLVPWAERHWGRKDPGSFVADEVAGFLLVVLLWRTSDLPLTLAWSFALARLFDIIKIPPARQAERIGGGWGVLLDDLAASVQAAIVLHAGSWLAPGVFGANPWVLGWSV